MKINVLIFPAGEVNSIELHSSLSKNVNVELFGASSLERHGRFVFKNYISGLPLIIDDNFNEEFQSIVDTYNIDLVFPTHDTVAEYFSKFRDKFSCKFVVPEYNTSNICRDKELTYKEFSDEKFIAKHFTSISNISSDELPVFIKPKKGQGSVGAEKVGTMFQLENYNDSDLFDNVICEYLPGKEYTIDCFTNFEGDLVLVCPRLRERTTAGICSSGRTIRATKEIKDIAKSINAKLSFDGLWYFQLKEDRNGDLKLLEVSCRTSGTMCLTRSVGYNLPLLSVYNAMRKKVDVIDNNYTTVVDRILTNKFELDVEYDTAYIDYDDTIILGDSVNLDAIRYIYQLKNFSKKIVLITRHEGDLDASLKRHNILPGIFDEIIHIKDKRRKSEFIAPNSTSIFIDNAFSERKDVSEKCAIPVFDADAFEVLLDWRV